MTVRSGTTKTTTYTLDVAGNVTRRDVNGAVTSFVYDGNRLNSVTKGGRTDKYWYDPDGRLDCVTTDTGTRSADCNTPEGGTVSAKLLADYAYDHRHRIRALKTYTTDGTTSTIDKNTEYVHDALDRLNWQSESHGSSGTRRTDFAYLGLTGLVSQETLTGSTISKTKSYSYDIYGNRVSFTNATDSSSATYTYAHDVHGSVSLLVNSLGEARAAYGYTAYGDTDSELTKELQPGSTTETPDDEPLNPYRYSAKRLDSGSGTLDMGARRFGPDISRFLQADLYNDALADLSLSLDPLTGNRYSLAAGNPVSFVEADGHRLDEGAGGSASFNPSAKGLTFTPNTNRSGARGRKFERAYSTRFRRLKGGAGAGIDCSRARHELSSVQAYHCARAQHERAREYMEMFPREDADIYCNRGPLEAVDCATIFWGGPKLGILRAAGTKIKAAVRRLLGKGDNAGSVSTPVAFAPGTAASALPDHRLQHATDHLQKAGVLRPWRAKTSPSVYREKLMPILERPLATFDDDLGGVPTKVFTGYIDGREVAIHIFKQGNYAGEIGTAVIPSGFQRVKWGFS